MRTLAWPDLIAAALMASLFICSAIRIIAQAAGERRGASEFLPES